VKELARKSGPTAVVLIPVVIIAIVSFAVYFNALFNDFVYDDIPQVLDNPWIKDVRNIPEIFSKSVWSFKQEFGMSNYYRPMMHLIYMLNYHLFGLKPWGFHLLNVLFHVGVSLMVFVIATRLLGGPEMSGIAPPLHGAPADVLRSLFTSHDSRSFAFIAALLFAVHPIHTEAVTWVAGLPEVSFTFFSLLSFYLYIRAVAGFTRDYLFSVVFFSLAILCKETALTMLLIFIAYDYAFQKDKGGLSAHIMQYIPFAIATGIYMVLRYNALGGFAPEKRYAYLSTYQYAINVFPLFAQYVGKLLVPMNLNAFYVFHPVSSLFGTKGITGVAVTAAFVAFAMLSLRKNRLVFFSILLIAVPLVPALYIPALGENTFAERYLYLPSVGFVILAGMLLDRTKAEVVSGLPIVAAALLITGGLYSVGTVHRNTLWKDNYVLFSDTVKKSPDAAVIRNHLGNALVEQDRFDEAIEQYRISIKLRPDYWKAYSNLGAAYGEKGLLEEAVEQLEIAVRLNPHQQSEARGNLETAYKFLESGNNALEQLENIVRAAPASPSAHYHLGNAYARKGLMKKAIEEYQGALKLNPYLIDAHYNLGNVYANTGQSDKAIEHLATAVSLKPDNPLYHNALGIIYGQKRMFDKAIGEFKAAVELAPSEPAYRKNLDRAAGMKNSVLKRGRD